MGGDPPLAHAIYRLSGAAPTFVDRSSDRRRRAGGSGHGLGPAVAHDGTRGATRVHGRRAAIGEGRWRIVAAGARLLHRRTGLGGIVRTRLSLPRLVGVVLAGPGRHPAVVAGVDRAASAIRLVLFRRSVL